MALKPGLFQAHNNLGNVLRRQGKLDQAAARYRASARSAGRILPRHTTTWATSSRTRASSTRRWRGIEQAIALRPDYAEAYNNLGNVAEGAGQVRRGAGTLRARLWPSGRTTPNHITIAPI